MLGQFYFAWATGTETTFSEGSHAIWDEDIIGFELLHREGEFAGLSMTIRNPHEGLLKTGRKQWCWFSYDAGVAGIVPLFYGRLLAIPSNLASDAITVEFAARPKDFAEQKETLADTLRDYPNYDAIWIAEDERDNPDAVLEAYTYAWHIDRITHEVTVSDINDAEDGTYIFTGDDLVEGASLDIKYGQPPLRAVRVLAEAHWVQVGEGEIDCTSQLTAAFVATGTDGDGRISSLTGDGLINDWPNEQTSIGGGWTFGPFDMRQVSGGSKSVECQYFEAPGEEEVPPIIPPPPVTIIFPELTFVPTFILRYKAERRRREKVKFTLFADVQRVSFDPGDSQRETISVSTASLMEDMDLGDPIPDERRKPIRDLRRANYAPTFRGHFSVQYLICLAKAMIYRRARMVEIQLLIPFERGLDLSCRKKVQITDDRLPGGIAVGKIVGYRLYGSGDGQFGAEITIACSVGRGGTITPEAGTPEWAEADYVDGSYQKFNGATVVPTPGVSYGDYYVDPNDDGINFYKMLPDELVTNLHVVNGVADQRDALNDNFIDVPAAIAALNEVPTQVDLTMKPVEGGPFTTSYVVPVSDLKVPKTIDLEAA
jgi:hypothetical protein